MEVGFQAGAVLLGKYRVESLLGRGGMGVVLRVTHLHLGEELAIKILLPEATSPEGHARFLREAQSVVRLRGEHVTRVIDVGVLPEGAPYMVMEHLRGLDLADELRRRGTLAPGEAVDYVLQACEALAEAHANGIIHRDIKPGNLFLTKRPDGTPLIKVLDFGISKAPVGARGALTRTDSVMGTPGYMSPEQMKAAKDTDARTDIWALGIILYECLTGRRPFEAEAFSAVVLMAATEPPPPMDRRIPRALQGAVLRCLEKQREGRFPSIAELAAALAPFARDQRAAATIVDRTSLMSRGASAAIDHPGGSPHSPTATTLSGSAGAAQLRSRRRSYAIIGATSLLVSIGGLAAAMLASSERSGSLTAASTVEGPAAPPEALDAVEASTVEIDGGLDRRDDIVPAQRSKLDECATHKAQKHWQALEDCADALDRLGSEDGKALRVTARRERANEFGANQLRTAVRSGNLKTGETLLSKIDPDSVYFVSSRDELEHAEAAQSEAAARKAQGYAKAQDCTALTQYIAELVATSTERVATAARGVGCGRAPAAIPPSSTPAAKTGCAAINVDETMREAERLYKTGRARVALGLVTRALACKQDYGMYQAAVQYACGARDQASARLYFANAPAAFKPILEQQCKLDNISLSSSPAVVTTPAPASVAAPAPASTACEGVDVDKLMSQASTMYNAGDAKGALAAVVKALACKQDARMLRFAVNYACAAHDLAAAKLYFSKVPAQFQPNAEQRCQQEGLNVRSP